MGLNGIDNGWIQFNHVRIPHDHMLSRYAQVCLWGLSIVGGWCLIPFNPPPKPSQSSPPYKQTATESISQPTDPTPQTNQL